MRFTVVTLGVLAVVVALAFFFGPSGREAAASDNFFAGNVWVVCFAWLGIVAMIASTGRNFGLGDRIIRCAARFASGMCGVFALGWFMTP
ncbi:MAG: hypothetical protein ABIE94_00320 [archaeon]